MKTSIRLLTNSAMAGWICAACWLRASEGFAVSAEVTADSPIKTATMASASLSTNVTDVIQLSESGVEEEVVLAYIENYQTPFALSADDIVYLKDIGISAEIITAMLHRDAVLREQGVQPGAMSTNQFAYDQKLYQPATNIPPVVPQAIYVTNAPPQVVYFYDMLAPYGSWVELEDYGWCWQPRVVVIDRYWRPYWHGGRWIYTDFGWYWYSDYTWGWAPFHYGRWHRHHRHGWVWFPDLVWAPAWVSWRYSETHCGWAPLPPGAHFVVGQGCRFNNVSVGINFDFHLGSDLFTFVEIRHLHERHPHLHAIPAAQVREIHNRTTVINNYVAGQNNRIINQGVAVDRVVAASGREIHPVTIKEVRAPSDSAIGRDRVAKEGAAAVLYHPELKAPVRTSPVIAQRIDERRTIVRPAPRRPSITPPDGAPTPTAKPGPPTAVPPARTPPPKGTESRPIRPAPPPKAAPGPTKKPEPVPVAPRPAPERSLRPPSGGTPQQPVQPVIPRHMPSSPPRFETPKGREQRLSNGSRMERRSPTPAIPPSSRPPPQKGTEHRPPSSKDVKPD